MGSVVHLIDASQQRDDAYRAIGRYMVEFSALIADMRNLTAGRITTAETQERELIELAFGGLMAQQVADPLPTSTRRDVTSRSAYASRSSKRSRNATESRTATGWSLDGPTLTSKCRPWP